MASGSSCVTPMAPNACWAWSITSVAISVAKTLIIEASMRDVAALVLLDRGIHHHQAAGMQLGRGVGDPPLDGLTVGELLAEGHPLAGVLDQHVERALGHADAPRAHLQAAHGEAQLHRREARRRCGPAPGVSCTRQSSNTTS